MSLALSKIQWGDAPTWLGFIAAGIAAFFAFRSFQKMRDQVSDQRDFIADQLVFIGDQRQFMADQMTFIGDQRQFMIEQSANLALERQALTADAAARRASQARQVTMNVVRTESTCMARVLNGSNAPLKDVDLRFGAYVVSAMEVHPNNEQLPRGPERPTPLEVVGPGAVFNFWLRGHSADTIREARARLQFTDENGVSWLVDEYNSLSEVP
ncbi:hypothetical protein [Streptomyces sp. CB03911]|uniref:hypothetical protein n=1 Tax=Streptomyces sp. CB03911 TaxID=1804758 RepID=UPI00093DA698|nr:hypothetical protein [Streptomyces sp. CB03911]OKI22219.1 hypothetical protein A6A07_34665 [Streptomyces sp. CB03911]